MIESPLRRPIRSFVRRTGRMTRAQSDALESLWSRYGLDERDGLLDFPHLFHRTAPIWLEIGFGNGESFATLAATRPDIDFLGVDVHRPGIGHLFLRLQQHDMGNVRVISADALHVLSAHIPDGALDAVLLFFPDPWPKRRHRKRRIVQPVFIDLLAKKLKMGGVFHMATDWQDYAAYALDVLDHASAFENQAAQGGYAERPDYRPLTKFERRGQRLGHGIFDLVFKRVENPGSR